MFGNMSSRFQELLLEGLFDYHALPPALDLLNQTCGTETAQLIVLSQTNKILESALIGSVDRDLFHKEEEYLPVNPRAMALSSIKTGRTVQDYDFIDDERIASNAAYQELLIPARVGRFAGAALSRGRDDVTILAIAQPWEAGPLEKVTVRHFSDAVRQAIPIVYLSEQLITTRARSLLDMLGPDARAAIVEADGTLLDYSPGFAHLLTAGVIRTDQYGQLDLKSGTANKTFAASLGGEATMIGGHFLLRPEPAGDAYVCTVAPVPPLGVVGGRSGHAILFLDRASSPRRLDRHGLMEAYSLTEEEYQICERLVASDYSDSSLAEGDLPKAGMEAVLWRIRRKTGSLRNADLVQKLLRHPLNLHDWHPFDRPEP